MDDRAGQEDSVCMWFNYTSLYFFISSYVSIVAFFFHSEGLIRLTDSQHTDFGFVKPGGTFSLRSVVTTIDSWFESRQQPPAYLELVSWFSSVETSCWDSTMTQETVVPCYAVLSSNLLCD